MLTPRQRETMDFLVAQAATGIGPSISEIQTALGLASKSGVFRILDGLTKRGFIRRVYGQHRSIEVLRRPPPANLALQPRIGNVRLRFIPILPAHGTLPERAA